MVWLAAVVAVLALIFFLIASPGFRKFSLSLVVLLVLGGVVVYSYNEREEWRRANAIKATDIALTNVRLTKPEYSSFLKLSGDIKNNSSHAITNVQFRVLAYDCGQKPCQIIGDETTSSYGKVPPYQIRNFEVTVMFSNMPKVTEWNWDYQITKITAE